MIAAIQQRAQLLAGIRAFFSERDITEVETPLLSQHTVTDLHIESFTTTYKNGSEESVYYLQTSPEYAMKRLLAAGSGPIFQICKAFRNGEAGQQHNPEFTMLEWYRPGFNHHDLIAEVDLLLQQVLHLQPADTISYQDLFLKFLNIDPFDITLQTLLVKLEQQQDIQVDPQDLDKDTCLQLLLSHCIEPQLGIDRPLALYDFPTTQAALAKIRHDSPAVAERFEIYIQGTEIANGFHELTDATEQQQRFEQDQQKRQARGDLNIPSIDQRFINALQDGLPDCSGVAIGLDRLLMIQQKTTRISNVIHFPWTLA